MIRIIMALFLTGFVCGTSHAGSIADIPLSKDSTRLLAGHLSIRMPEGSMVEPRRASIMAAEDSPEEETRVVFNLGKKRLVLMAYETFTLEGGDFAAQVKKMDQKASREGGTVKSEIIIERKDFRVYQSNPEPIDAEGEAILVASAWVVHTDKTIQLITLYANPDAASDLQAVQELSDQFLKTLEPGKKPLSFNAREQSLSIYSKEKSLLVKLPEGWVNTIQQGPDFIVHNLRKVAPFGDKPPSIGIYIGGHPSYHYSRGDTEPEKSKGSLIGEKTEWFNVSEDEHFLMESMRPAKEVGDHMVFHVWLSAASEKDLGVVKEIVDSMRIIENPKAKQDREKPPAADNLKVAPEL